jgi:hypothetical protein
MTTWNPNIYTIIVFDLNSNRRHINTPTMGRTCYRAIEVEGRENLEVLVDELIAKGEEITEVYSRKGNHITKRLNGSRLY